MYVEAGDIQPRRGGSGVERRGDACVALARGSISPRFLGEPNNKLFINK
jgi:hypothetical protein